MIYRYLSSCEPVEVDVTLLSVADRLATRGRGAGPAIARHLELAREMLERRLEMACLSVRGRPCAATRSRAPSGSSRGPSSAGFSPSSQEAAFVGEVQTEEQALRRARELLGHASGAER